MIAIFRAIQYITKHYTAIHHNTHAEHRDHRATTHEQHRHQDNKPPQFVHAQIAKTQAIVA